ncbi:MAG TPA: sulfurtransferase [Rudaea sp.]|jgi:thiosulfate/3-mercaptopyruvate sulfurtransferase|nr:sulfurtransferase [Rudaea sp.]
MKTLISAAELHALDRNDVLIADCRSNLADVDGGARDYAKAHIPNAVYADLNRDLSDLSKLGVGRHPLPNADAFSRVLSRWGWAPQTFVVAYDDAGGALAASRLWWMLRLVGGNGAVLDGGIKAWTSAGFELTDAVTARTPSNVDVAFDASQIVMTDELQRLRNDSRTLLLDARAAPRYRGETEPIDRVAGHVPRARNRPFSENLGEGGTIKSAADLRSAFTAAIGGHASRDVVHMCGSGVTACHNLLAMEHAGLAGSRIYAPSWSGWIADDGRDIAVGADSTIS